jgi:hypothetical protein
MTGKKVHIPSGHEEKAMQRALLQYNRPGNREIVRKALIKAGRQDLIGNGAKALIPGNSGKAGKTGNPRSRGKAQYRKKPDSGSRRAGGKRGRA